MKNAEWFYSLNKPFLNPPERLFAPVWIILYIMIAISFILFIKDGITKEKKLPFAFFITQMLLNFAWHPVFFGLHNIGASLAVITLLWIFILLSVISFFKYSKTASILLIPYLIWVSFAFYLNFSYFVLN